MGDICREPVGGEKEKVESLDVREGKRWRMKRRRRRDG